MKIRLLKDIRINWTKNRFKDMRFVTSAVGSFPQPEELRKARVLLRKGELGQKAYDELVKKHTKEWLSIQDQIGIEVVVSGEFDRQDMAVFFGERFSGTKLGDFIPSYENRRYRPVIYEGLPGGVRWVKPIALPMFKFVYGNSDRFIKETITGPATLFDWGLRRSKKYYFSPDSLRSDLTAALRKEIQSLIDGGVDILQVDEPALTAKMLEFEKDCRDLQKLVSGFENDLYLILHICYSTEEALDQAFPSLLKLPFHQIHIEMANRNYRLVKLLDKHGFGDKDIGLGVIDIHSDRLETAEEILSGIKKVLPIVPPERIWVTPDCGLKERSKEVAIAKLKVMAEAAKRARELFK